MDLHTLRTLALAVCPLATVLMVVVLSTGWRRWAAGVLAVPTGGVLAFELYSGWVGGNLTGLFWILSLPLVLIGVAVVSVAEVIARASGRPTPKRSSPPPEGGSK